MNFQFKKATRPLQALSAVVLLFAMTSIADADVPTSSPTAAPSAGAAPNTSAVQVGSAPSAGASTAVPGAANPGALPVGSAPSVPVDKKKLMAEYSRAQINQEKAMQHNSRSELKELQAAQGQRAKSWRESERKKRKDFFESHASGPDRRTFVQDYLKRKKELDEAQKSDYEDAKKKWVSKFEDLKKKQKEQAAEFKSKVDQGRTPDQSLWPN